MKPQDYNSSDYVTGNGGEGFFRARAWLSGVVTWGLSPHVLKKTPEPASESGRMGQFNGKTYGEEAGEAWRGHSSAVPLQEKSRRAARTSPVRYRSPSAAAT